MSPHAAPANVNVRRGGLKDLPKVNDVISCQAGMSLGLGKPVCVTPCRSGSPLPDVGEVSTALHEEVLDGLGVPRRMLQRVSGELQVTEKQNKNEAWEVGSVQRESHSIQAAKQGVRIRFVLRSPKICISK